jgi:Fatty acid desaturase
MPHERPEMRLRCHTSNILERPFLHYLNYNYHGEHHLYPRIPSRNLPALANWLKEQGYAVERSPSYLATLLVVIVEELRIIIVTDVAMVLAMKRIECGKIDDAPPSGEEARRAGERLLLRLRPGKKSAAGIPR